MGELTTPMAGVLAALKSLKFTFLMLDFILAGGGASAFGLGLTLRMIPPTSSATTDY